jgi:hypothetical protein
LECGGAPPLFRRHRERRSKQKKATAKMDRKFQEVRRNIFAALLISEGCSNRFNEPREASWSAVALYRFDGRAGGGSKSLNAVGIFRPTNFQNSI